MNDERAGGGGGEPHDPVRLRLLTEQVPAILWSVDRELCITSSTGAALRGLGLRPGQVVGTSMHEFVRDTESSDRILAAHRRALDGESVDYEAVFRTRAFHCHVDPLRNEAGEIEGAVGVASDVTGRWRAERALLAIVEETSFTVGEEFFRSLVRILAASLEADHVFVGEVHSDGRRVRSLAVWRHDDFGEDLDYELDGTPCEDVVRTAACLVPSGVRQAFPRDELLVELGVDSYRGVPLRTPEGEAIGLLVVMDSRPMEADATVERLLAVFASRASAELQRHSAERALRESEERFRALAENVPGVIYLCANDRDRSWLYLNAEVRRLTGYPVGDFLARRISFDDLYHPEDAPNVEAAIAAAVAEHRPFHLTYRVRHKDGRWRWVEDRGVGVFRGDELVCIEGFLSDVTERHRAADERERLEEQMRHAQKLESLGVLAGGVAHDFNNLLVGILGNASLALDVPESEPVRRQLLEIARAARRAADLAGQMLAYSGRGRFEVRTVDLNELLVEMEHLLEAAISKKARLSCAFGRSRPRIEADPTQLRQVVMNLVTNASEALGTQGGTIALRTGELEATRTRLAAAYLDDGLPPGRYAFLEVRDAGSGMDEATRARIFDPFFTTKLTGRGLGMAVVMGIVRSHGGAIEVETTPGLGSTFTVLFPATSREADPLEEPDFEPPAGAPAHGLVLVADDEEMVRDVAVASLEAAGFEVLTAENGREAIEVLRANAERVVAVLLDVAMPVLSGEEALPELRRIRADVPVVLTSGYSASDDFARFAELGRLSFVQKPYTPSRLAAALRAAIASGGQRSANDAT